MKKTNVFSLLSLAFIISSCGNGTLPFQSPVSKRQGNLGPIKENIVRTDSSRISNPKTEEDYAINEIQDLYDIQKKLEFSLNQRGTFLIEYQHSMIPNAPLNYSPKIVLKELNLIKKEMPKELSDILYKKVAIPELLETDLYTLSYWTSKIRQASSKAVRWQQVISPKIDFWKEKAVNDIRGYAYFKNFNTIQLNENLSNFSSQDQNFKEQALLNLTRLCINSAKSFSNCEIEVNKAKDQNQLVAFFQKYINKSKDIYNAYFVPKKSNVDIRFTDSLTLETLFTKPKEPNLIENAKSGIENTWKLFESTEPKKAIKITYVPYDSLKTASIETRPNVVSRTENQKKIVLNSQLSGFEMQKTLAHEFGHVLGFSDCYVEFFDSYNNEAIYYEIDQTNIMCSLNGKVSDAHFKELEIYK